MACQSSASGEFLLTAGTALAIQMSRTLTAEEMELLSAFLEVLGDQLALLALKMPQNGDGAKCRSSAAASPDQTAYP